MKTLLICGYFAKENEEEIQKAARKPVEYSSNNYLRNLIDGFKNINEDVYVLSAPMIGSYPNASGIMRFTAFEKQQNECEYVPFLNVWGIRNLSRAKALKKAVKRILSEHSSESFRIVVCSVHTPLLQCAAYAKKLRPDTKICLVVPDLPQYMHLDGKASLLYRVAKAVDIRQFNRLNRIVDSYLLLTEFMKEKIDIHGRPYIVSEGLIRDEVYQGMNALSEAEKENTLRYIVYTGKTYEKFGIKNLIQAFMMTSNENYRLVICGSGDSDSYIKEKAQADGRIAYLGQVPPTEAQRWIKQASVLVNPRQNNEEYTKYSFPSKNLEYLASGNGVVLYLLDGIKKVYSDFCVIPENDSVESLKNALEIAAEMDDIQVKEKYSRFLEYAKTLSASEVCRGIQSLLK